jgi:hypothetical protein
MALDADDVTVSITGEMHVAPVGTAAPVSAVAVLAAAFKGLGYVNEDGITESPEESTETIRAWQNGTTVRTVFSESAIRFNATLIQNTRDVVELYHKGSQVVFANGTDDSAGYKIDVKNPAPDPRSFVFDVIDGDKHLRIYIPKGEVVERGEVEYVNTNAIGYPVTIECVPVGDIVMTKFFNDPAWADDTP